MGIWYNIVFDIEEAEGWMPYDNDPNGEYTANKSYKLHEEIIDGRKVYYVINEKGEKQYDPWKTRRGDFVSAY